MLMKLRLVKASVIVLFTLMLLFPAKVFEGACNGLMLWFHSVLPTLLPFMILSGILIKTRAIHWIVRISGPLLGRIFHVSDYATFAVITGFLCGYPMGSRITSDLLREGHISLDEAGYLLSFCNNASPIFIISYIVQQNLRQDKFLFPSLIILTLSPVIASFFFRHLRLYTYFGSKNQTVKNVFLPEASEKNENILDSCIMSGFESITKVGGYIILFSIMLSLAEIPELPYAGFQYFFLPSLEITNGISLICQNLTGNFAFFLCMVMTSFGGFCAIAQTKCMINGTGLSIFPYMIEKLITALVTSLLCLFYLICV